MPDPHRIRPGDLLVSHVWVSDGVFDRTVVLILDADDNGNLGVVLNRINTLRLGAVLPAWQDQVCEPAVLFDGGPVSPHGAICLAELDGDEEPPGWGRLFGQIGLLHLDTPVELVAGAYARLRIFAGYAGWDAGQLEAEIAGGYWFVVDGRPEDVFTADPDTLWRAVLRRQRLDIAIYATWPDDHEVN